MSKDNRDMSNKNLEDKMVEARHKWRGFFCNDDGSCSDTPDKVYGTGFFDGYELAQKEMQEKLDAAIEVIKEIAEYQCAECNDYQKARDFLEEMEE